MRAASYAAFAVSNVCCADHGLRELQLVALEGRPRVLERDLRRGEIRLGLRELRRAPARRAARAFVSSSRAMTSSRSTRWPSSIETSTTLPVIFDDTVACRRATT